MSHKDRMAEAVLQYTALGFKLVLLYGVDENGACECRNGASCRSGGKHPRLNDWQGNATDDEDTLLDLLEKFPQANIGLLLGPKSGVIDIEFDCEEGRATADKLFEGITTFTYKSGRSVHRIFQWHAGLPDLQKLTPSGEDNELNGLEIRIGGGAKSTQSVIPPSRYYKGGHYESLPTLELENEPPAKLPRHILNLIVNQGTLKAKVSTGQGLAIVTGDRVTEGGRNDKLFKYACLTVADIRNLGNEERIEAFRDSIHGINMQRCNPPLEEIEVNALVDSAIKLEQAGRTIEDRAQVEKTYGKHGLARNGDQFLPGDWTLERIMSDPPRYCLTVPAWKDATEQQSGEVDITMNDYDDPGKVAAAIRLATMGSIIVNKTPREWPTIWNGSAGSKDKMATVGLKALLVDESTERVALFGEKKYASLGEYFLNRLSIASAATEDGSGKEEIYSNEPTLFKSGEVWFRWSQMWEPAQQEGLANEDDIARFRKRLGLQKWNSVRWPHHPKRGEPRITFLRLRGSDLERIRTMVYGVDCETGVDAEIEYNEAS